VVASCHFFLELIPNHDRKMENNILEIKIENTAFTVEAKNAEILTITSVDVLKKMASDEALKQ